MMHMRNGQRCAHADVKVDKEVDSTGEMNKKEKKRRKRDDQEKER